MYFEHQYARARRILTKVIAITSIMDDIYDAYGIVGELQTLTKAIDEFDIVFKLLNLHINLYYIYLILKSELCNLFSGGILTA